MVRARASLALGLSLALGAPAAACSAVLPSNHPIACEIGADGVDPCLPLRMRCIDGQCLNACTDLEICNLVDDDCDGATDEGIDADRDGVTGCAPGTTDCNDLDPDVHPGAPEICNGVDDDCSGSVDVPPAGAPPLCAEGEACIPRRGGCVVPSCADPESPRCSTGYVCDPVRGECIPGDDCTLAPGLCATGEVCDPLTHRCVTPAPLGSPCNTDYECSSRRCYPVSEALRLMPGIAMGRGGICGQACCSDADCPAGSLCWTPGTGARSCVARGVLSPVPSRRACADDRACEGGACVLGTASGYDRSDIGGTWCGASAVTSESVCDANSDCRSGHCLFLHRDLRGIRFGVCAFPCRTSDFCKAVEAAYNGAWPWENRLTRVSLHCGYVRFEGSGDWFPICLPTDNMEDPPGAACATHAECLDDGCIRGTCRSVCCADSDCPSGEQCRPHSISGRWQMHCGTPADALPPG